MSVVKFFAEGPKPKISKSGDAGIDLCYCGKVPFKFEKGYVHKIPTGVFVEIPEGQCGIVFERSGLGSKHGYTVHGRIIDSGYRGEIMVLASFNAARIADISSKEIQDSRPVEVLVDEKNGIYESAVILSSHNTDVVKPLIIKPGDRVAQMVVIPYNAELIEIFSKQGLSNSERGSAGLGSTGVK